MASQAAQVPFEERMRTLDRVVDEVTQLAQKAASKDEAITTLKHGMTKVINRLRYEIDVAREARDVYKAQRDSLRDDVAALKAACRCGAGSAIPDPVALPPAASGGGGSFRLANSSGPPPAKPASTVKKALPLAPPVASPPPSLSTSPRGAAAAPPPARSPFSVTSAPMGVAAPPMMMAPPANYALSAPPAPPPQQNQQYLALDDISMPQQSEYDHVPPYSAGGGFPPIVSPREGDYRPLPPQAGQGQQQANSRAQYVAVTLNRGTSVDGNKQKFG